MSALERALAYARGDSPLRRNVRVLPCSRDDKAPLGALVPHGKDDATTDEDTIRGWWTARPDAAIGGVPEGWTAVDLDVAVEDAPWLGLEGVTLAASTPRGARHYFLAGDTGLRRILSPDGVPAGEIRSAGSGYVILPDGIDPARHWLYVEAGMAPLPEHLAADEREGDVKAIGADVRALLVGLPAGEPCPGLAAVVEQWMSQLAAGRHETMTRGVLALLRMGDVGHPGAVGVIARFRDAFVAEVTADGSRDAREALREWQRALTSAGEIVLGEPAWRDGDPCTESTSAREARQLDELFDTDEGEVVPPPDQGTSPVEGYPTVTIGQLLARPPITWRVEGWLPAGPFLVEIQGPRGVGKTTMGASLGFAMLSGGTWMGLRCAGGRPLYLALEGPYVLADKARGYAQAHKVDLTTLEAMPVVESTHLGLVKDRGARLIATVNELQADLVVIDAWRQALEGGSDRDPEDVNPLLTVLDHVRRTSGATVVILHNTGWADVTRGRGASEFEDAADVILVPERWESGDGFTLRQTKNRLAAQQAERVNVRLEAGTVVAADPAETSDRDAADRKVIAAVIDHPGVSMRGLQELLPVLGNRTKTRALLLRLEQSGMVTLSEGERGAWNITATSTAKAWHDMTI